MATKDVDLAVVAGSEAVPLPCSRQGTFEEGVGSAPRRVLGASRQADEPQDAHSAHKRSHTADVVGLY